MLVMNLTAIGLFASTLCNSKTDEKMEEYFPKISFEDQDTIFNEYCALIEQEKVNLSQFQESCICATRLKEYNSKNRKLGKHLNFAIDFGGSSLKISTVEIEYTKIGEKPTFKTLNQKNFVYSAENTEKLLQMQWYEWVAIKVKDYINNDLKDIVKFHEQQISAALTFSFPMKMKKLDSGIVFDCTKPFFFSKKGFLNSDVVECLNNEFIKRDIGVYVNCVINDAVATYVAGVAENAINPIALIIGTGTNSGFSIMTNTGEEKIINPEMATFKSKGMKIDLATKEIIGEDKDETCCLNLLEVSVAGLKFVQLIQKAAEYFTKEELLNDTVTDCNASLNGTVTDCNASLNGTVIDYDHAVIDLEFIKDCVKSVETKTIPEHINNQKQFDLIKKIIMKFKHRAYKMLAPIIVAIGHNENFTIIGNGTILSYEIDQNMLKKEIKDFIEKKFKNPKEFSLIQNNDATLHGAAFASLVYSDDLLN